MAQKAPASATGIELDPDEARRKHELWSRHFNVVEVPLSRAFGLFLVTLLVVVHNRLFLPSYSRAELLRFVLVLAVYAGFSWLALRTFYGRTGPLDLGHAFLALDIAVFLFAIYHTGGERSWLLFLLIVRVADQATTSLGQVRTYAHLSVLGYLLLLLYLERVEGRGLSWPIESFKLLAIYSVNLYVSFTARAAEGLRRRTSDSVRLARQLILTLREKQAQIEEARAQAEELSRLKSEFIANISHEIRTPLGAIIGMATIALDADLPAEAREHLRTIAASAQALKAVVDGVLDFSRLEEGRLDLEPAPFRLRAWLEDTIDALLPQVREKGLELAWGVGEDLPGTVVADDGRLRQVLLEIVTNAVKFTDRGKIEIRVERESGGDGGMLAHFWVTDTGVGIPAEKRELIFEAFTQGDASLARRYGGIGLGLSLAARLVARLGGRLWLESEVGKGSTFHFTARFEQALPGQALPTAGAGPPADAFDREAALARLGGDEALLRDAVQAFLEDCPRLVGQLREAVERRDAASVKSAAHAIKGTVAIFSAHPTHEAAARLERLGDQGQLAGIEAEAQRLEMELERFKTAAATFAGPPPP